MSGVRLAGLVWALAAAPWLGACERTGPAPAPSSGPSAAAADSAPASGSPAAEAGPAPASGSPIQAVPPSAGTDAPAFDAGEVKTAAQYLEEPELAAADLQRGQLLSLACAACHTFGAGQKAIIGPNLHGVFGRRAASVPDFDYSPALRASGLVWTPRSLEAWLADPARFVAGTTMTFTGYRSAEDRRDLIAYLLHATE